MRLTTSGGCYQICPGTPIIDENYGRSLSIFLPKYSVPGLSKLIKIIIIIIIIFLSEFSFTTIHKSQNCRGRGRAFL